MCSLYAKENKSGTNKILNHQLVLSYYMFMRRYLEQQIGNNTTMLVEHSNITRSIGKSKHFTKMQIKQKLPVGSIVNCKIQEVHENVLQAVLI